MMEIRCADGRILWASNLLIASLVISVIISFLKSLQNYNKKLTDASKTAKNLRQEAVFKFFYCYDAPMMLSGVLVVGIFQSSVVVSFVVAGTVVVIGKLLPIFRFQVLYQIIVDAELREQFKLFGL